MALLLGIDVGTTSVKAGLFSADGRSHVIAKQEYRLETPKPEIAQLDPEVYWQGVVQTVREVTQTQKSRIAEITALAVSSQGETTLFLNHEGVPLYPAVIWMDNRAVSQSNTLADQFQNDLYQTTGITEFLSTWTASKILWFKENEPEKFKSIWKYMLVQDYIIYRLTGYTVTDVSVACTTALLDIHTKSWWPEMLDFLGISKAQLPEILPPGTIVSKLSDSVADELGLLPSTLVVNGGMDQAVGAIGSGNIAPGLVSETTGAALVIQAVTNNIPQDAERPIPIYCHSVPDQFFYAPVCPTAGMALKWLKDSFFKAEEDQAVDSGKDIYSELTTLAATIPAGSDGLLFLPHLMGKASPLANTQARGAFCGLSLMHGKAHFIRAVMEGIAFMLLENLVFLEQAGVVITELRVTGGASKSALWNQIMADVCRVPIITLHTEDTALLGDVILAGVASQTYPSIAEGCRRLVKEKQKFLPSTDMDIYQECYLQYCRLDQTMGDYFLS